MSPEFHVLLIAIVTLSQILVMSFIAPISLRRFCTQQYDSHPETEYPRWYPVPRSELERLLQRHVVVLMGVGLIGLLVLVCCVVFSVSTSVLSAFMVCFLLLQLWSGHLAWLPGMRKVLHAMREMPPPVRRSVELHRWRITDFVSPLMIVPGFASQLAVLAAGTYVYLEGRPDVPGLPVVIAVLAVTVWILGRLVYRVVRPAAPVRIDPNMSDVDLHRLRQRVIQGQFVQAAALGVLNSFALLIFGGVVVLDPLWFFLGFSLLVQLRSLLSPGSLFRFVRSQDFSVYRAA
jgi:hypothetical protein